MTTPQPDPWYCPHCGLCVAADEDICCKSCGATCGTLRLVLRHLANPTGPLSSKSRGIIRAWIQRRTQPSARRSRR